MDTYDHMNELNPNERDGRNTFSTFPLILVDFCLLNLAYFLINYWKRGTFTLPPIYVKLLLAFYGIWLMVSLLNKKFQWSQYEFLWRGWKTIIRSGLYLVYGVTILVVVLGLYAFSRGQIFGTCLVFVFGECVLLSILHLFYLKQKQDDRKEVPSSKETLVNISLPLMLADSIILFVSFFVINYFKRDSFHVLPDYEKLLFLIFGLWFLSSFATRKFESRYYRNYYHAIWPWIKSAILMAFGMAFILYALRLLYFSRTQVFGPVLVMLCVEIVLFRIYYVFKNKNDTEDIESIAEVKLRTRQEKLTESVDLDKIRKFLLSPVREGLRTKYLKETPAFFDFLDSAINLSDIIQAEMSLQNSCETISYNQMNGHPVRLYINLHKINDFRWLNRNFLQAHNKLLKGGYFIGKVHTLDTHKNWMFKKFPRYIAAMLYTVDFIVHRVFPKLPWTKQVYYSITKGRSQIISQAEVLGRLVFCGFNIVDVKEIDERLYFIAQKAMTPSIDQNPTYGPFVKLERIGENGRIIDVYKFRTMHPYSEYLQDYIYQKEGLKKGGKIENDFRVTGWGKIARKLWIDELPMLYNWIKGDLNIVGVRPLSSHYFSLYPKALKKLRNHVMPGLVPPYYADLPETFDQICESERHYIESYLKRPFLTQWSYFWKAFYNITFRGVRSS